MIRFIRNLFAKFTATELPCYEWKGMGGIDFDQDIWNEQGEIRRQLIEEVR